MVSWEVGLPWVYCGLYSYNYNCHVAPGVHIILILTISYFQCIKTSQQYDDNEIDLIQQIYWIYTKESWSDAYSIYTIDL